MSNWPVMIPSLGHTHWLTVRVLEPRKKRRLEARQPQRTAPSSLPAVPELPKDAHLGADLDSPHPLPRRG